MTILDWSPINRTPHHPQQGQCGREDTARPPVVSSRPLTGCIADYDALAEAVRVYRASYARPAYEAMRDAATRCGLPDGERAKLTWAEARLRTYRQMMESA